MMQKKLKPIEILRRSLQDNKASGRLRKFISEMDIKKYLVAVHEAGQSRCKEQGTKFNPADFAAGALVFLNFVGRMDMMPAEWFFGMHLSGRNPFESKEEA